MYTLGNLKGPEGNAFAIMGRVTDAMKDCSFSRVDIELYINNAKSSDYDHLVKVSHEMINKCNQRNKV